ncbi:MAG TPA: serine/threonine-protein kinase [Candidatus Dormibacteraeota bacterium]|nr:serine/threonine-protein kinase [Candidatus Dormibacteraeota bacterium]
MAERVGKYWLEGLIGSGASGAVYFARDVELGRPVAIKALAPALLESGLAQFRHEAQVMARVEHPNCVRVFALEEEDGRAYLVCELVEGASLRGVMAKSRRLTPEQALGVLAGSLAGLAHAHSLGLAHRDVKPENVLVDLEGTSKLADFGQAMAVGAGAPPGLAGTPAYMAPEALAAPVAVSGDLYACGVMLYELLTGGLPFETVEPLALLRRKATEPPPDPRRARRDLPEPVAALVRDSMAIDPAARPQSAEVFAARLEAAAAAGYGADWHSRASIRALAAAAAGVAALAGGLIAGGASAAAAGTDVAAGSVGAAGGAGAGGSAGSVGAAGGAGAGGSAVGAGAGGSAGGAGAAGAGGSTGSASTTAKAKPASGRSGPLGVPLSLLAAGVAGLLLIGGAGGYYLLNRDGGSAAAINGALAGSFGPPPPVTLGELPASSRAGTPSFTSLSGGRVVEVTTLAGPRDVGLGFAFCNSFTCGNSDNVDCVGNLYIPAFASSIHYSMTIGKVTGWTLERVLVTAGQAPGSTSAYAYTDAAGGSTAPGLLAAPARISANGAELDFPIPPAQALKAHYRPQFQRVCGFTQPELIAFQARYGTVYHNPYPYITVILSWTRAGGDVAGLTQAVGIDGQASDVPVKVAGAGPASRGFTAYRQDDARWATTRAGTSTYASSGTVPAAVASLLNGFGKGGDPVRVGAALERAGAWKPGGAATWAALGAYLADQGLTPAGADLPAAAAAATQGVPSLVGYTSSGGRESALVITGYDSGRDRFQVLDPARGRVEMRWDDLAAGNPWILEVGG